MHKLQSSDHVEHLPVRDCQKKFDLVLLFATRPRRSSRNYSLRIEAFSHSTLTYRASWRFPVRFLFLPVYPLPVPLRIPGADRTVLDVCVPSCVHGRCLRYVNDPSSFFCQCQSGWSGEQCQIKHHSRCAPKAYSIAGAICLCPLRVAMVLDVLFPPSRVPPTSLFIKVNAFLMTNDTRLS